MDKDIQTRIIDLRNKFVQYYSLSPTVVLMGKKEREKLEIAFSQTHPHYFGRIFGMQIIVVNEESYLRTGILKGETNG